MGSWLEVRKGWRITLGRVREVGILGEGAGVLSSDSKPFSSTENWNCSLSCKDSWGISSGWFQCGQRLSFPLKRQQLCVISLTSLGFLLILPLRSFCSQDLLGLPGLG